MFIWGIASSWQLYVEKGQDVNEGFGVTINYQNPQQVIDLQGSMSDVQLFGLQ